MRETITASIQFSKLNWTGLLPCPDAITKDEPWNEISLVVKSCILTYSLLLFIYPSGDDVLNSK